jgi:SAM-dependent methyltransferase
MSQFVEQGHLGGYIQGGDEATWYPELWTWLVEEKGVKTVLDVGCGEGLTVDYFSNLGCEAIGIEGVEQDHPRIIQQDFTLGEADLDRQGYDLVWSCEFVEHVEEKYMHNFLDAFKRGKIVLMTHASPGQAGYNHVNCQDQSYWVGVMAGIGYKLDEELTTLTRGMAAFNQSPWNHYKRSGLAFVKRG